MRASVACPRVLHHLLAALLLLPTVGAMAQQQDDMRRLLDQRGERQAQERERTLLADEAEAARPTITVDGRSYTVEHTASDVGRALYVSLRNRAWPQVRHFLAEYLTIADRDPMLVHYAQGAIARSEGRYRAAEREYRALLALMPAFLPGRLELARVLFEDQQDREAEQVFASIEASIDAADPKTEGVRASIASFRAALANRRAWHGVASFGPAWSDNINRTSASNICLLAIEGQCLYSRSTPRAIASSGYDYDANLDRRIALRGHHGVYLRTLLFGQGYLRTHAFDELTSITQAGYSFRSGRHALSLAPSFEYYALGNDALYGAWGVHADWNWTLSADALLRVEADWKDLRYRQPLYADNYDGVLRQLSATWIRSLGPRWTLFGGVDLGDSGAVQEVNAFVQKGLRAGAVLQWPQDITSTLLLSYRHRDLSAYSALLEARRADDEYGANLIVKAQRWRVAGFVPVLTLRHSRVDSNVDWLYGFDRSTISVKLERAL